MGFWSKIFGSSQDNNSIIINGDYISGTDLIKGNGVMVEKDYTDCLENVKKLDYRIISNLQLQVEEGIKPQLIVHAEENILPIIKVQVKGSTLHIHSKGSYSTSKKIKIILNLPFLNEIISSGVSKIEGSYEGEQLKLDVSGTGSMTLEGTVNKLQMEISGTSKVDLEHLIANTVKVEQSGTSKSKMHANDSAQIDISGVATAEVYGNPEKLESNTSGLGKVKKC